MALNNESQSCANHKILGALERALGPEIGMEAINHITQDVEALKTTSLNALNEPVLQDLQVNVLFQCGD